MHFVVGVTGKEVVEEQRGSRPAIAWAPACDEVTVKVGYSCRLDVLHLERRGD